VQFASKQGRIRTSVAREGGGGDAFGQGRGRGRGNGAAHDTEQQDIFMLHRNDNFQRRFRNVND